MKAWNDFEAKRSGNGREILPAGGYVCEIKNAKLDEQSYGNKLVLMIEVTEGEYANFWKKDYDNNTNDDRKWRGVYRVPYPMNESAEEAWKKRTFGKFVFAVQESNPGYVWNWDENTLKGKKVGVLYRNKEWEMNGMTGWTTEAAGSCPVEDIREGKFKQLKDKPLGQRASQTAYSAPAYAEDEEELPF